MHNVMAETKKSHKRKNMSSELHDVFKKNPLSKLNGEQSNDVQTADPYAEDAKRKKYWRSLQSFKPLRFSR